jgi:hypothetical protein
MRRRLLRWLTRWADWPHGAVSTHASPTGLSARRFALWLLSSPSNLMPFAWSGECTMSSTLAWCCVTQSGEFITDDDDTVSSASAEACRVWVAWLRGLRGLPASSRTARGPAKVRFRSSRLSQAGEKRVKRALRNDGYAGCDGSEVARRAFVVHAAKDGHRAQHLDGCAEETYMRAYIISYTCICVDINTHSDGPARYTEVIVPGKGSRRAPRFHCART